MESDRRNYPPGVDFFHTGVRRRKYKLGLPADLLRLTEFILPPPHSSVKEIHPGVIPKINSLGARNFLDVDVFLESKRWMGSADVAVGGLHCFQRLWFGGGAKARRRGVWP